MGVPSCNIGARKLIKIRREIKSGPQVMKVREYVPL